MEGYVGIVVALAITLTLVIIFVSIIAFVRRKKRIEEYNGRINRIAKHIIRELGNVEKVNNAKLNVSAYESKVKELRRNVRKANQVYRSESLARSFLNIGHKKRLDDYSKNLENAKTALDEYVMNNGDEYQKNLSMLESVEYNFFIENLEKITREIQKEELAAKERERLEQQKQIEKQEQEKQRLCDEVRNKRETEIRLLEERNRMEKVAKRIREMEEYMPVLQSHVREHRILDFSMLRFIEDNLDVIEDGKGLINPDDFNNIERIQKKLSGIFDMFKNDESFKPNINLIEESFRKIFSVRK